MLDVLWVSPSWPVILLSLKPQPSLRKGQLSASLVSDWSVAEDFKNRLRSYRASIKWVMGGMGGEGLSLQIGGSQN